MAEAAPRAPTEQELRELMLRSEQVRQQVAQLEAQREYLLEVTAETRRALTTLEAMTSAKPGEDILVPVGAGSFVHAKLAQPGKAIANLGNGVHAEVSADDAAARLRARVDNLDGANQNLARDIERLSDELARASAILEPYLGGA